jgi:hypothetical protein
MKEGGKGRQEWKGKVQVSKEGRGAQVGVRQVFSKSTQRRKDTHLNPMHRLSLVLALRLQYERLEDRVRAGDDAVFTSVSARLPRQRKRRRRGKSRTPH